LGKAKDVIEFMRDEMLALRKRVRIGEAAQLLLDNLTAKLAEAKKSTYIGNLLKNQSESRQKALRPMLEKCASRQEINETWLTVKALITEDSSSRGLPPLNEGAGRTGTLTVRSEHPIVEARNPNTEPHDTPTTTQGKMLSESARIASAFAARQQKLRA
jgi:ribonuclease D